MIGRELTVFETDNPGAIGGAVTNGPALTKTATTTQNAAKEKFA